MPIRENPSAGQVGVMADELHDETLAAVADGAGGDETEVVPPVTEAAPELAWSAEEDATEVLAAHQWRSVWAIAGVGVLCAIAAAVAVVGLGVMRASQRSAEVHAPRRTSTAVPAAAPAPPTLDGTYQFEGHPAQNTYRLKTAPPGPMDNKVIPSWWAFRSVCLPTGCAAHGVLLDKDDHQRFDPSNATKDLTFADGAWRDTNPRITTNDCGNGKSETVVHWAWMLRPQPDGTLRGTATNTITSDGCGFLGNTTIMPISATRVGDAPDGLAVPSTVAPVAAAPDVPVWPVQAVKTEDENLLAELADHGVIVSEIHAADGPYSNGAGGLISAAHAVCDMRTKGASTASVINDIADPRSGLGLPAEQAKWLAKLATQTYCPQYEGN